MKHFSYLSLLLLTVAANAQITLDNSYFPAEGDVLRIATDFNAPANLFDPTATGMQTWDFSALQSFDFRTLYVNNAATGAGAANYPDAELVIIDGQTGAEEYVNVTNTTFEVIGYFGPDPTGLGVDVATALEKPIVERTAPLTFGNFFSTESAFAIRLGWDDLPTAILDSFLNLPVQPDSLAVIFSSTRTDVVDAFGMLTIPDGSYEVLRQKRTEERTTSIEVKVPFLGWLDVTDLVPFGNLGDQTLVSYLFFSNQAKEVIARVDMNATSDTIQNVVFKYDPDVSTKEYAQNKLPFLRLYPNPVIATTQVLLENLPNGRYELQLFDLLGKPKWSQELAINGNLERNLDFNKLTDGIYFLTLKDEKGKLITTKKMMKVSP